LIANAETGTYSLTANVAGISPAGFLLTNSAAASNGPSLSGSANSNTDTIELTADGTLDWVPWGDGSLSRKGNVTPLISNSPVVGSGPVMTYANDPRPIDWYDGSPLLASTNNLNGVYINFVGNGFSFTVPADPTIRTLIVHIGGWFSGGTFTAHLSDGSAPDYVNSTAPVNGQYDRNYTIVYSSASSGRTLNVSWVNSSSGGNVTLNAAALQ
jgi:hypothetical protein